MANRRMIGDVLSERRRALGLSVERVVADTKLQRRMVEAFEDSDFDAMPPRGYAQASLASYARYLGLDAREVLRDYEDQLYDHQREESMGSRPSARGRRAGVEPEVPRGRSRRGGRGESSTAFDERPERPDTYTGRVTARGSREEHADGDAYRRRSDAGYGYGRARDEGRSYASGGRASTRDSYANTDPRGSEGDYARGNASRRAASSGRGSQQAYRDERGTSSERYRDAGARPYSSARTREDATVRPARHEEDGRYRSERPTREQAGTRPGRAGSRPVNEERPRRATQVVGLDDGYEGGSGGGHDEERYRSRAERRGTSAQRQSFNEALEGFLAAVRSDRRTFAIILVAIVATAAIVIAITVSSCVRSMSASTSETSSDTAVTPVATTPLTPSIDLSALPAESTFTLTVSESLAKSVWAEIYVDGAAKYARLLVAGETIQEAFNSSLSITLTPDAEGVSISVNGIAVSPTPDTTGSVLTATVAAGA